MDRSQIHVWQDRIIGWQQAIDYSSAAIGLSDWLQSKLFSRSIVHDGRVCSRIDDQVSLLVSLTTPEMTPLFLKYLVWRFLHIVKNVSPILRNLIRGELQALEKDTEPSPRKLWLYSAGKE